MTPQEIMERAANLSSFDGQVLGLIGEGDDLLNFRGKGTNIANQKLDQFTMILANANAAVREARLFTPISMNFPVLYPGQALTGAFNDINGAAGLSGSSGKANFPIESFLYYVAKNPSRLTHLRLKSTVASQLDYELVLDEVNPYKNVENQFFSPSNEIGQDTQQTSIVIFAVDAQLDYLSDLSLSISPLSTATMTFFMGTEVNVAKSLDKKFTKAAAMQGAMGGKIQEMNANRGLARIRR